MSDALDRQIYAEDRGAVRWVILDRRESRNGLSLPVVERLAALVDAAQAEASVRALVLFGAGGSFCSGLDLKAAYSLVETGGTAVDDGLALFQRLVVAVQRVTKPTIAAVDGAAVGFGCDLALGCDLRVASTRARIGSSFARIGLMPDGGGTLFLQQLVGRAKALELIYEARLLDAEQALAVGLFNKVWPEAGFETSVQDYALSLAAGPPLALAAAKRAVLGADGTLACTLALEGEGQRALLRSADFMEGVQAFVQKRPADFRGR